MTMKTDSILMKQRRKAREPPGPTSSAPSNSGKRVKLVNLLSTTYSILFQYKTLDESIHPTLNSLSQLMLGIEHNKLQKVDWMQLDLTIQNHFDYLSALDARDMIRAEQESLQNAIEKVAEKPPSAPKLVKESKQAFTLISEQNRLISEEIDQGKSNEAKERAEQLRQDISHKYANFFRSSNIDKIWKTTVIDECRRYLEKIIDFLQLKDLSLPPDYELIYKLLASLKIGQEATRSRSETELPKVRKSNNKSSARSVTSSTASTDGIPQVKENNNDNKSSPQAKKTSPKSEKARNSPQNGKYSPKHNERVPSEHLLNYSSPKNESPKNDNKKISPKDQNKESNSPKRTSIARKKRIVSPTRIESPKSNTIELSPINSPGIIPNSGMQSPKSTPSPNKNNDSIPKPDLSTPPKKTIYKEKRASTPSRSGIPLPPKQRFTPPASNLLSERRILKHKDTVLTETTPFTQNVKRIVNQARNSGQYHIKSRERGKTTAIQAIIPLHLSDEEEMDISLSSSESNEDFNFQSKVVSNQKRSKSIMPMQKSKLPVRTQSEIRYRDKSDYISQFATTDRSKQIKPLLLRLNSSKDVLPSSLFSDSDSSSSDIVFNTLQPPRSNPIIPPKLNNVPSPTEEIERTLKRFSRHKMIEKAKGSVDELVADLQTYTTNHKLISQAEIDKVQNLISNIEECLTGSNTMSELQAHLFEAGKAINVLNEKGADASQMNLIEQRLRSIQQKTSADQYMHHEIQRFLISINVSKEIYDLNVQITEMFQKRRSNEIEILQLLARQKSLIAQLPGITNNKL